MYGVTNYSLKSLHFVSSTQMIVTIYTMYSFHKKLHWKANHLQKQRGPIAEGVTDITVHLQWTMNRAITISISCFVCDLKRTPQAVL
jgi:hypothetical protein